jgi:Membrane bound O-acyl transferase family
MTTLAFRSLVWSFETEPYYRVTNQDPLNKDESKPLTLESVAKDALDLTFNLRGLGWSWSERLFVPEETRPTESRTKFLLATLRLLLTTVLAFDIPHYTIQCFGPTTFGTARGGTIFDPALPPLHRYLFSSFISLLAGITVICGIQIGYYMCTIVGVGLLQNDPSDWPPAFDKPWVSTSLNEFWTRRWHQSFRDIFVGAGSKPLHYFFGKPGIVAGAFLVSGILHVFGLWGMGRGTEFWSVAGYFLLMGVGLVLEHVYRAVSGKRVGGYPGQIWTLLWVIGWGNLLVDAWFRKGLGGSAFFPDRLRPAELLLKAIR